MCVAVVAQLISPGEVVLPAEPTPAPRPQPRIVPASMTVRPDPAGKEAYPNEAEISAVGRAARSASEDGISASIHWVRLFNRQSREQPDDLSQAGPAATARAGSHATARLRDQLLWLFDEFSGVRGTSMSNSTPPICGTSPSFSCNEDPISLGVAETNRMRISCAPAQTLLPIALP